jgi:hypothetical protein
MVRVGDIREVQLSGGAVRRNDVQSDMCGVQAERVQ